MAFVSPPPRFKLLPIAESSDPRASLIAGVGNSNSGVVNSGVGANSEEDKGVTGSFLGALGGLWKGKK